MFRARTTETRPSGPHRGGGSGFKVAITLTATATVTVVITHHGHVVKTLEDGARAAGAVTATLKAPSKKGRYGVRVVASERCGTQQLSKKLRVR